jgi:tetratricopeptide (TPR) repeat protein
MTNIFSILYKRNFLIVFVSLCIFLFSSCKSDHASTPEFKEITELELQYNQSKSDTSFYKLVQSIGKAVVTTNDLKTKEALLNKAIGLCSDPQKKNLHDVFTTEMLKVNPDAESTKEILWNLAESMVDKNKPKVASVLFIGFKKRYQGDSRSKETEKYILTEHKDLNAHIKNLATSIFDNPGPKGINELASQEYIDICESFALAFPKDPMAPEYLFRAAEMARALGTLPKMMSLYDWIYAYYPKYKKAPLALFLKGFAMDSDLKNPKEAKNIYEKFLAEHPNDSLVNDVKFLLKNLGKSDEEILKQMEIKK